jgi:cytoskeletal protein CcmA (bactofilin family)
MSSNINPNNINGNFPVAGQDNDSQGFRDNFTNILNNFSFASSEITDLQNSINAVQLVVQTNGNVAPYYANVAQGLIVNGKSNLYGDVAAAGNVTIAGNLTVTGNIYETSTITINQQEIVAGNITTSGNIVTGYITTAQGTGANLTIDPDGNADVIITAGNVWLTAGNLRSTATTFTIANVYPTSANLFGNASSIYMGATAGNIISRGGFTGTGYFYANGVNILSGVTGTYSNSNVAAYLPSYAGNITLGNLLVNNNSTFTGNIVTGNLSTPAGGIITATVIGATGITVTGNINANGGNVTTSASTATLFNTTATTVNAFGAATTITMGATGGNTNITGFLTVSSAIQFANLTTTQINAITPTNRGMTVYNYTTGNVQVYNGTKWANITLS